MPRNIRLRRRRGSSSILEAVISLTIFGGIMVILLALLSNISGWTSKATAVTEQKVDIDYLVETISCDIKSSSSAEVVGDELQLVSSEKIISYILKTDTLYRNNQRVISDVNSCMFVPEAGDMVGLYIELKDGTVVDMTVRR